MVSVIEIALGKYENQIGDFPVLRAFPLSFETPRPVLFVYLWKKFQVAVLVSFWNVKYLATVLLKLIQISFMLVLRI